MDDMLSSLCGSLFVYRTDPSGVYNDPTDVGVRQPRPCNEQRPIKAPPPVCTTLTTNQ